MCVINNDSSLITMIVYSILKSMSQQICYVKQVECVILFIFYNYIYFRR